MLKKPKADEEVKLLTDVLTEAHLAGDFPRRDGTILSITQRALIRPSNLSLPLQTEAS
jgi:hypothetical protein